MDKELVFGLSNQTLGWLLTLAIWALAVMCLIQYRWIRKERQAKEVSCLCGAKQLPSKRRRG